MRGVCYACLLLLMLTGVSCQTKKDTLLDSQRDALVDSIVGSRMGEITRMAAEDLDRRRSIEVKAKADSIAAARMGLQPPAPADNTLPNNTPMP